MHREAWKQLFDRNLQANRELLTRAGGVWRQAVVRRGTAGDSADPKRLLDDLLRLQVEYVSRLSEQSVQFLGAVVGLAESVVAPTAGATAASKAPVAPEAPAVQPTILRGAPGQTLQFRFQLDNPNPQAVNASIECRDWQAASGHAFAPTNLQFSPGATEVAAGGAQAILGTLQVDERFEPGQHYDTVIRVVGFPGREVPLRLEVTGVDAG